MSIYSNKQKVEKQIKTENPLTTFSDLEFKIMRN